MADIRKLIKQVAAEERAFRGVRFVAPCVAGSRLRVRIAGFVQALAPHPPDFTGWGIFSARDEKTADLVEEAGLREIGEYLKLLLPLRVRLAHPLKEKTWLAHPVSESDMAQRVGVAKPVVVHLVDADAFDTVIVRGNAGAWWFQEVDRRADPREADQLREAMRQVVPPTELRFKGLTPEMRTSYDLAARQKAEFFAMVQHERDEKRLSEALALGGGDLRQFRDRGEYWQVVWTTAAGDRQTSAISKTDLTVMSSGICLSGRDRDFDLQSLVGVIEQRGPEWEY